MTTGDGTTTASSANGGSPAFTAPESADEVREWVRSSGIEFLFAQFVDMHGKPNAKLVPATPPGRPADRGGGVRGLRRRRHRPGARATRT